MPRSRVFSRFATASLQGGRFLWLAWIAAILQCAESEPAPCVLWVTVDTLRQDALGCYGNEDTRTPHFDRLAREGLRVAECVTPVPLTLPAHASLFTGRLPPDLGLHDNSPYALSAEIPTLATILRENGYATGASIGGQPLAAGCGLEQGFDSYDSPTIAKRGSLTFAERSAKEVTERALRWLNSSAKNSPQFLWVHYFDPHHPYTPPPELASKRAHERDRYAAEVTHVDQEFARVLDTLQEDSRRWLVVVTSDHGEGLGDHGEATHGYQVFDSTMVVPLLLAEVHGSTIAPPRVSAPPQHACLIDLLPTTLDWLGQASPAGLPGRSLLSESAEEPGAYIESLAGSLHFGWAQITGWRTSEGVLLWAGAQASHPSMKSTTVTSESDATLWWSENGEAPGGRTCRHWAEQLHHGRTQSTPTEQEAILESIVSLGYVGGPRDPQRHRLLSPEVNQTLPSPVARRGMIQEFLQAVEELGTPAGGAAADRFERLCREDPDNPTFWFYAARAWMKRSQSRRSADDARQAAVRFAESLARRDSVDSRMLEIKALAMGGEFDRAKEQATALHTRSPTAETMELLGALHVEARSIDGVIANPHYDLEQGFGLLVGALERDPDNRSLRALLERALPTTANTPWAAALQRRLDELRVPESRE